MQPRLIAISVGTVKAMALNHGREIPTAIAKTPVSTLAMPHPVAVTSLGLEGDHQADHRVHGGPFKAVYAYPAMHYGFWAEEMEEVMGIRPELNWGQFCENLTIEGLDETTVFVGDRWRLGAVELEVVKNREPCFKFNVHMRLKGALETMLRTGFCGWYLKVNQPGQLHAGQAIEVHPGPQELTIRQLNNEIALKQGVTPLASPFR